MAALRAEDQVRITPSGDEHRPIRIEVPERDPLDVTRAEMIAIRRAANFYLIRTFPAPSVRRDSNVGS